MSVVTHLNRRARLAFAFIALLVVASGCVRVEFTSEFQRSGPALHALSVVIPREEYDAADAAGQTAAFDEISSNAADAGLRASKIVTDESVTLRVSIERPDGEDAGAALNSLLNATGINQSPGISAPFSGYFRQEGAAVGGSNFVLNMSIDGPLLYDQVAASEPAAGEAREVVESEVSISYEVMVPGDLRDSTGELTPEGTVSWEIEPDETIFTQTEASAGAPGRAALFIIAAIISVAGVVVLAAIVGWILVRRPRLATSIASAASHFPRRTTITREGVWVSNRVRQIVERFWHRGAPHQEPPIQDELLASEPETERADDGADTEGDRPAACIHGR